MEKCIPEGRYNLILVIPEKYLGVMEKTHIVKMYGVHQGDLITFEDAENPYFEVHFDDADIHEIVSDLVKNQVEADIQVMPLYQDQKYQTRVDFNVYIRNTKDEGTVSYINTKDEENLAYELTELLKELNDNDIHEANTIIAKRINQLHSVGWI